MAQPSEMEQIKSEQRELTDLFFERYKEEIVENFIDEFGKSYQTAEQFKNSWQQDFEYTPEREQFLISKTRLFLYTLPSDNKYFSSHAFLHKLISNICKYLAKYTYRKNVKTDISSHKKQQECDKSYSELFTELYKNFGYIQNQLTEYNKQVQLDLAAKKMLEQQKAEPEQPQKRIRKRIGDHKPTLSIENKIVVTYHQAAAAKLEGKRLNKKLRIKNIQIVQYMQDQSR